MKPKIRRATQQEKQDYDGLYPLYGWLVFDDNEPDRAIEDLRGSWSKPDPIYEVMVSDGRVGYDGCHSYLCYDLEDVRTGGAQPSEPETEEEVCE